MSYWEKDPYVPESDRSTPPTEGGRSCLARAAVGSLMAVARNEGVEVFGDDEIDVCINTGATEYQYDPRRPEIVVRTSQPWPQARWCLAVALGHHFTRHHFYQLTDRATWKQQAEQWALSFLAAHTAEQSKHAYLLPDNTRRAPVRQPRPTVQPVRSTSGQRLHFRLGTCKGFKADGKPCRGLRSPGSDFCRHHQGTELPTLEDIVAGQNWERPGE